MYRSQRLEGLEGVRFERVVLRAFCISSEPIKGFTSFLCIDLLLMMLHCYEAAVACATAWLAIHKSAVNPFLTESERMIRLIPDRQQDRRIRLITIRRCRYLRNGRRKTSPSQLISSHNHHPHPKQPVSSSSISRNPIPDHTQTANSPRYASQPNQQNPHKNALSTQAQPSTSSRPHAQNAQTHPPPKSSCLYSPAHQCNCGLKPGSRRRRTRE